MFSPPASRRDWEGNPCPVIDRLHVIIVRPRRSQNPPFEHIQSEPFTYRTAHQDDCRNMMSIKRSGSCFNSWKPEVLFTPSMWSSTKSSAISCGTYRKKIKTKKAGQRARLRVDQAAIQSSQRRMPKARITARTDDTNFCPQRARSEFKNNKGYSRSSWLLIGDRAWIPVSSGVYVLPSVPPRCAYVPTGR